MSTEQIKITKARILSQEECIMRERWQTCLNCDHWRERPMSGKTMVCGLYDQTPPPEVLVVGCENHMWNIPF